MRISRPAELRPERLPALTVDARHWGASDPAERRRSPALAASGLLHVAVVLALAVFGAGAIAPRPEPDTLELLFDPAPALSPDPLPPEPISSPVQAQPAPEPELPPAAAEREPPAQPTEPPSAPVLEAAPPAPSVVAPAPAPAPVRRAPRPAAPVRNAPVRPHATQDDPKPRAEPPAPAAPAVPVSIDPGWRRALNAWLAAHKRYPETARMRGIEGIVGVAFTAEHDGRVLDVTITRSSGSAVLDNSVRDMLAGQRVPAFPASMAQQASLSLAIRYTLEQ